MNIVIYDKTNNRWIKRVQGKEPEKLGLAIALESAHEELFPNNDKPEYPLFSNTINIDNTADLIIIHTSNENDMIGLDLKSDKGPNVLKFSGGAAREVIGENKERVFALELPIQDPIFTKAETWKDILKYISDPKNQSKPACMGLSLQYISLRSQILTPFAALHLALQMNQEEQRPYLKNLSAEDRQLFQKGLDLLNNKDLLVRKFSELAGIPFEEGKALSRPQKDINEFIQNYAKPLSAIFQGIIDKKQIELPISVDVLLTGIERLSEIVEDGIEKSDLIKKARVIKHDLDNVMRRLDNCISPLSPEKIEVIKGGMERLDSIFKELIALKESLHLDMQNELDSASELIRKIRDGVKTNLEESRLLELRDELVGVLQKPFNMIVSVTTGQEK